MGAKLFTRRFHPFCGFYLQGVLRLSAIINASVMVFIFIFVLLAIERHFYKPYAKDSLNYYLLWTLSAIYGTVIAGSLLLDYILFKAAKEKNIGLLKLFIGGTVVLVLVLQTAFWVNTIHFSVGIPNPRMAVCVSYTILRVYIIYAAISFVEEIKTEENIVSGFRDLADYEIDEFYDGHEQISSLATIPDTHVKCMHGKFMKDEFGIFLSDLEMDKGAPLGWGAYGTVYRALLSRLNGDDKIPVAVKTTNPLSSNVEHFKALLSELKVMTWIGNHENVVNLIGACTEDIKKRKLYIVLELCAFGNLHNYLKSQRGTFVDLTEPPAYLGSHVSLDINNDEDLTSTKYLVKWAKEIADGMDFLESRKVVHGDLAARNVLLTEQRVAKITDFGLSRQLYNYAVYMKTQASPLPWRWLALEAILDMRYSTQSDVWSYGVTIWELFQLGEIPWPGCKFSIEFVNELERGKTMEKPKYATQGIYQIMLDCWEKAPEKRPTFKALSETFQSIHQHLNHEHLTM